MNTDQLIQKQIVDLRIKRPSDLSFGSFSAIEVNRTNPDPIYRWKGESSYTVVSYDYLESIGFEIQQLKTDLHIWIGPFSLRVVWRIPSYEIVVLKRIV